MTAETNHPLDETLTELRRFRCRHIFPDGHRCGSPSLRHQNFCYYHHATRGLAAMRLARTVRGFQPTLPDACDLTERSGVQLAIAEVLHLIAANDIELRRAGLLLYGLQTAANILPRLNQDAANRPIEDFNNDPEYGHLALPAEIQEHEEKSSLQLLLERLAPDSAGLETTPSDILEPAGTEPTPAPATEPQLTESEQL